MKVAIIAITRQGKSTAFKIKEFLPESQLYLPAKLHKENKHARSFEGKLTDLTNKLFREFKGIIFCMAAGIVVRVIAASLENKHTDPAIVVVDDQGRFAISLLSGHEGGANSLAIRVANSLGAEPVVTTASESRKKIVIGIGCRRGIDKKEIVKAVRYAIKRIGSSIKKIRCIATIDLKQNERGLQEACNRLEIPLRIVSAELIKKFRGTYKKSAFVKEKIGVEGVSEPCALIVAKKPKLILAKTKIGRVTIAAAEEA